MTQWTSSLDLGGSMWQFGHVLPQPLWQDTDLDKVSEWLNATIPGNVESDLLALGLIPDPYVGLQNEQSRWVEQRDWWYRRSLHVTLSPQQRAHLILHGVDYYTAVYINGTLLGRHEGMFSQQIYEISSLVHQADNNLSLAIRLWGAHALPQRCLNPWQRLADPLLRLITGTDMFPSRTRTLKCQMSFGWDFAPRLPTIGIWDDVELVISGPAFIRDLWVAAEPQGNIAHIRIRLLVDSKAAGTARIAVTVTPDNFNDTPMTLAFDKELHQGMHEYEVTFILEQPNLWQPWDRGQPHLYRLAICIEPLGNAPPSEAWTTFGIRSIDMVTASDRTGSPWAFVINGEREFIRGVNWVPADALPGRLRPDDYAHLLAMVKEAGANMVRVWGGGLREKRAFYDLCDRSGLLVWQEFPFACPNLLRYPTDKRFLDLVNQEVTAIVRALRNHPSIVLWCGGNELSPSRNRLLIETLKRIAVIHDGTRPFRPASPSPGDNHNWLVWHHFAPVSDYCKEQSAFVSEFGLQAPPSVSTLQCFLSPSDLWPPGSAWAYHNAELSKLWHYIRSRMLSRDKHSITLESFVAQAQEAQALGMQIMVEHMRRRKGESGGVIVWQLNEPWPSICWSLIGYNHQPKLAYHTLQRVFAPVLVSVDYPIRQYKPGDLIHLHLWIINDHLSAIPQGECQVRLVLNGKEMYTQAAGVAANSSHQVGEITLRLPNEPKPWILRAELWLQGHLLCENEYDLSYYEGQRMPLLHRFLALFGRWLLW